MNGDILIFNDHILSSSISSSLNRLLTWMALSCLLSSKVGQSFFFFYKRRKTDYRFSLVFKRFTVFFFCGNIFEKISEFYSEKRVYGRIKKKKTTRVNRENSLKMLYRVKNLYRKMFSQILPTPRAQFKRDLSVLSASDLYAFMYSLKW